MSDQETTPLPWEVESNDRSDATASLRSGDYDYVTVGFNGFEEPDLTTADAELIVRRVNAGPAVDALVAALLARHARAYIDGIAACAYCSELAGSPVPYLCPDARDLTTYQDTIKEANDA